MRDFLATGSRKAFGEPTAIDANTTEMHALSVLNLKFTILSHQLPQADRVKPGGRLGGGTEVLIDGFTFVSPLYAATDYRIPPTAERAFTKSRRPS